MFNPTNIDEESIKDTNLEASKGNHVFENVSNKPHNYKNWSKGKGSVRRQQHSRKMKRILCVPTARRRGMRRQSVVICI